MSVACRTREFAVTMCTSLVFTHYRGPIEEYDEGMQSLPGMQPIFVLLGTFRILVRGVSRVI